MPTGAVGFTSSLLGFIVALMEVLNACRRVVPGPGPWLQRMRDGPLGTPCGPDATTRPGTRGDPQRHDVGSTAASATVIFCSGLQKSCYEAMLRHITSVGLPMLASRKYTTRISQDSSYNTTYLDGNYSCAHNMQHRIGHFGTRRRPTACHPP